MFLWWFVGVLKKWINDQVDIIFLWTKETGTSHGTGVVLAVAGAVSKIYTAGRSLLTGLYSMHCPE
jgi:Mg/Co/Ni transporter MgtE